MRVLQKFDKFHHNGDEIFPILSTLKFLQNEYTSMEQPATPTTKRDKQENSRNTLEKIDEKIKDFREKRMIRIENTFTRNNSKYFYGKLYYLKTCYL